MNCKLVIISLKINLCYKNELKQEYYNFKNKKINSNAYNLANFTNTIYNVGSGKTISVNRLVELLEGPCIHIPKRPGEPDCTFADISKIKHELNWSPKISIEKGIEILLENIDYWRTAPVWDEKSISSATKDWFKYLG